MQKASRNPRATAFLRCRVFAARPQRCFQAWIKRSRLTIRVSCPSYQRSLTDDSSDPTRINRIAFVFDFDDTLAEDSFSALLRQSDFDPETFKAEQVTPLVEAGWEEVFARSYTLVQAAARGEAQLTEETVAEVGQTIKIFEGVPEMFGHMREVVARTNPEMELEFYLLTSGSADIPHACSVAHEFRRILGGAFYFDDEGKLTYLKKSIPHAEKVSYSRLLSKGQRTGQQPCVRLPPGTRRRAVPAALTGRTPGRLERRPGVRPDA